MKHQTNMRGSNKHGDSSEFHRLPNLPAIFGNAFSPASGNGLRITYGHETHCRHSFKAPRLLAVAGCQPLPRTDAARAKMQGASDPMQGLSAKAGHLGRKSDRASTYSVRGVLPSTPPTRLTVTRGDKAQSPVSIASGTLLPRWQWANGLRVLRSRSLSILCAALLASFLAISPAQAGVSTSCLPRSVKAKLAYIERHFGRVEVISAYRKNAVIAGTRKRSKHSYCGAADFHVHGNRKGAAAWLLKQNGEFIRYSGHHTHWHIADGNWKGWKR